MFFINYKLNGKNYDVQEKVIVNVLEGRNNFGFVIGKLENLGILKVLNMQYGK